MNSYILPTCTRYNCVCDPPYSVTGVCNIYALASEPTVAASLSTTTTSVVPVGTVYSISRTCTRYNCACNPPYNITGYCEIYAPWRPTAPLTNDIKATNNTTSTSACSGVGSSSQTNTQS